jgi:hypothetical protein
MKMKGRIIYDRAKFGKDYTHYFFIINQNNMFEKIKQRARKALEPVMIEDTWAKGNNYEFWKALSPKEDLPFFEVYDGPWSKIPGFYKQMGKIKGLIERVENGEVPENLG